MPGPRSPFDLFLAFAHIGMLGFGGVLPWTHRILVEKRAWLSNDDFLALFSLSQLLPGPNVCNFSLMLGQRYFGMRGAIAGLSGLLLAPLCILSLLAALHHRFADWAPLERALHASSAVAAGLVVAMGIKMWVARPRPLWSWACCMAGFIAIGLLRWPLWPVVAVVGSLGCLAAWHSERKPHP